MDRERIKEACQLAEAYLVKVRPLEIEFSKGLKQVNETADTAEAMVIRRFATLQERINNLLTERKCTLLEKIQKAREEGTTPLYVSCSSMKEKIRNVEKFLKLGESILDRATPSNIRDVEEFSRQSKELDRNPILKTTTKVSYISFEADDDCLSILEEVISNYGNIATLGPVQLCDLKEKPGGIFVEWRMTDSDEQMVDVQEFCLQKASGDGVGDIPNFENCYVGEDTHYLCKDVVVDQYYSFRVSCKFEGSNSLSRWSIPLSFKTTIKSYNWKENGHYSMNDQFRIAKPLVDSPPMLISEGRQYRVGYTIEFTILEMDEGLAHIGLMTENKKTLSKMEDPNGTFIVDSRGTIKVDGITKSTFLPEFKKNCKICFTCECLKDTRVVIHIDIEEKRVTYEWSVNKSDPYFFAAELPSTKWKIMVE
ncbi:cytokine receptor-like factor 3 [Coccinella septempunctata]|uniref:cytokine receptor-like factor 3 n=1 Tax=Coccinella septempunctata TaxID=41139 RepID=UPI001D0829C0|nr:cytokine receptor-like factor 3 [Coccinella septempunctata]